VVSGVTLLAGCATAPHAPGPTVDLGSFIITAPSGDEWSTDTDQAGQSVTFTKAVKWITGAVTATVVIKAYENQVSADLYALSATEVADHYRGAERDIIQKEGAETGA
jgi:hypothetical protein